MCPTVIISVFKINVMNKHLQLYNKQSVQNNSMDKMVNSFGTIGYNKVNTVGNALPNGVDEHSPAVPFQNFGVYSFAYRLHCNNMYCRLEKS